MKKGRFCSSDAATGFIYKCALSKILCCYAILYPLTVQDREEYGTFSITILRPGNWIMPGRFVVGGRKSGSKSRWAIIMNVSPLSLLDYGAPFSSLVDGVFD